MESAALDRALRAPRMAVLDWMSGTASEKLLTTNTSSGRSRLVATSGTRHTHEGAPDPSRSVVATTQRG